MAIFGIFVASTSVMAAIEENFKIRNTGDLVALCSASSNDQLMTAAVNFCQGFATGAYQYHLVAAAASSAPPLVCPPNAPPSRNDVIAQFVTWANANTTASSLPAVEGMFRFLRERFPCAK
ncbi:Rap1a/Tai family immunity protein [Skermanella aerolata]|uniref:Rap1a/Tai family immunity protein n=1 Tax=Skermanella aerolata TaxID=393310 RepID=UPI001FCED44A|nr:Rap1a/Tai family immunity protein [Skermanella aerolata]